MLFLRVFHPIPKVNIIMALFLAVLQLQWLLVLPSSLKESRYISLPGCRDQCGNVAIPYPFGIGANCFYDESYEINCTSSDNPKPFLSRYNLEVTNINWGGRYSRRDPQFLEEGSTVQILTALTPPRNVCEHGNNGLVMDFGGNPFRFSHESNVFMVENYCGHKVMLRNREKKIVAGCASVCPNQSGVAKTKRTGCYGVGCCQASLLTSAYNYYPSDLSHDTNDYIEIVVHQEASTNPYSTNTTCTLVAALVDSSQAINFTGRLSDRSTLPTVFSWYPTTSLTRTVNMSFDRHNVSCDGGECYCVSPHEGNPYLPNGCQVVPECRRCKHRCFLVCPDHINHCRYHCENPFLKLGSILGFSISLGLVFLVLGCYWLYRFIKKRKEAKRKAKHFKRNGGLLLQQQVSSSEGAFDKTKIFGVTELEKATNNFGKNRILGQGGQGTVYKGMLTDGKIVAVKKSKLVDESQLEHFINELVIICQINHRNVVKLLGCCLETEVPLLVYEYIPNGTLYHLLHDPSEDFHITWKMRLQIAAESADALSYLHSSSATPIYHRDIKSSNILLDEKYRAKVSDFGTSRAITIEQTHVTTCVMGTYGYLDPEYFQSNQFTDKSDVYSFGVVLVELITGKKPICPTKSGGWVSLAYEFLFHMESSRLFEILDARVLEEGKGEEFIAVANLARQCLSMNGKLRPSMKEIAVVLDGIRSHKLPTSKEPHYQETKYAVIEMSDQRQARLRANTFSYNNVAGTRAPVRANTFSAKSDTGNSRSADDVQPLMLYSF